MSGPSCTLAIGTPDHCCPYHPRCCAGGTWHSRSQWRTLELRISLLTAALDQLFPEVQSALPTNGNNNGNGSGQNNGNGKAIDDPSNPGTTSPPANITAGWTLAQARIAAALLLARAQTHWEDNQPRAAMGDARRIEDHQLQGR
ncbi:MAG: hypothetical protein HC898_04060 [Phycisphaerales bacterium]|nr:hypothetical protein [Phycisphaerales bacterium]